jgi:hypothetical protein
MLMLMRAAMTVQVSEVAASPAAEVCWYFPNSREQYRIAGTLTIVDDQHPSEQMLRVGSWPGSTGPWRRHAHGQAQQPVPPAASGLASTAA